MLFNSFQFIVFFPLVVYLYFLIAPRYRWILLLTASYYFYMCWKPEYVVLLAASTLVGYWTALRMGRELIRSRRKKYLLVSIIFNLVILFIFKYFNFFDTSIRHVFEAFNIFYSTPSFNLLLPVGISFYTFQILSYSLDVYWDRCPPEKHLGVFALYVSFFPQLVAGPIERSTNLLPQFTRGHHFDWGRVKDGLRFMLWGFFKKIVIADNLAIFVDKVYSSPADFHGGTLLLATYFFAFQIYYDFSGYSDIAVGAARVLGYELMFNFRHPYFSVSIAEFWKRWHISLSSWFKDYLYIPLGGNKVSRSRWVLNIWTVFILSGLWHGAKWTFVIWGMIHAIYYISTRFMPSFSKAMEEVRSSGLLYWLYKASNMFILFHMVCFAWIFFRADSLSDASSIIGRIIKGGYQMDTLSSIVPYAGSLLIFGMLIVLVEGGTLFERKIYLAANAVAIYPRWIRWGLCYFLIFTLLILGNFETEQFIYFQF